MNAVRTCPSLGVVALGLPLLAATVAHAAEIEARGRLERLTILGIIPVWVIFAAHRRARRPAWTSHMNSGKPGSVT